MAFNVTLSSDALNDLSQILNYCVNKLNSEQAALSIYLDAQDTKTRLSHIANSLSDKYVINQISYKSIRFKKHKYLMIYRVVNDQDVLVTRVLHTSQDIKSKIPLISQP